MVVQKIEEVNFWNRTRALRIDQLKMIDNRLDAFVRVAFDELPFRTGRAAQLDRERPALAGYGADGRWKTRRPRTGPSAWSPNTATM